MRNHRFKFYFCFLFLIFAATASAKTLGPNEPHTPGTNTILVMVHPSKVFDFWRKAQDGVNRTYEFARERRFETYLLQDQYLEQLQTNPTRYTPDGKILEVYLEPAPNIWKGPTWAPVSLRENLIPGRNHSYYMDETPPTAYIISYGGEHQLRVKPAGSNIILTGGYFQYCMLNAIDSTLRGIQANYKSFNNITFTVVSDGTYVDCPAKKIDWPDNISTVRDCFQKLTQDEILKFFREKIAAVDPSLAKSKLATMNFFIEGTKVLSIGNGPAQINVQVLASENLPNIFPPSHSPATDSRPPPNGGEKIYRPD